MDELPGPLDRDVVQTTHDGTVLRIAPVFRPSLPPLLAMLTAALSVPIGAAIVAAVVMTGVQLPVGHFIDGMLAAVGATAIVGIVATLIASRLVVRAVRIELSTTRLQVRWEGGLRGPLDVPLAALRAVDLDGPVLILLTDAGVHRVRIPGRSTRTREALLQLVVGVRAAIEPRSGHVRDVPAALRDLRRDLE